MELATTTRNGKRFVLVPLGEYRKLIRGAEAAPPSLPAVDADGNSNAIDFMRASIARDLIRDRRAAGLSQQQLGKLAGVRQETISRIESGKHTATVRVIDKLDKVLRKAKRNGSAKPRWRG